MAPQRAAASGPTVNVKTDYGAFGDGAHDDSQAFKSALGYLSTSGGTLVVPSGIYLISPSAFVSVPTGVAVEGSSATLRAGAYGFSLIGIGGSGITVTGIMVDGAGKVVRGITVGSGSSNVTVQNSGVQNVTQPTDPTVAGYTQNHLQVAAGIRIEGNTDHITIDHSSVSNVKAVNYDPTAGIPTPVARGVWITPAAGDTVAHNVTVSNSSFSEVGPKDDGDCIVIQGTAADVTTDVNFAVTNNTFQRCHKRAVKIQVAGASITGNTIDNPFLGDNPYVTYPPSQDNFDMYSAISVYASDVNVADNTVSGVGSFYNGIELGADRPLSNVTVRHNSVAMGSNSRVQVSSLVRAFTAINPLTITDNTLDHATWGIRVNAPSALQTVTGNTITGTAYPLQCTTPCSGKAVVQSIAVPAYFYPGPDWARMDANTSTVRLAVMNPASGPGPSSNPDYVNQVSASQAAGLSVIGYVHTSYAARPSADGLAEIANYYTWYGVNGIFLDEVSTSCADEASYYAPLYTAIKAHGGIVVLNPGTSTNECYAAVSDILLMFEGSATTYATYSTPAWSNRYPRSHFWHVVYATPTSQLMQGAVLLSQQRGAGWVYVTPQTLPNPYSSLPPDPYWTDEVAAVAASNQGPPAQVPEAPQAALLLVVAALVAGMRAPGWWRRRDRPL